MTETTRICLDQKTSKSISKFFQTTKEKIDENFNINRKELEVFRLEEKEIKFLENNLRNIEKEKEKKANESQISAENESISEGEIIAQTFYFDEIEYSINHFMIWEHYYKKKVFEKQGININFEKNAVAMTNYIKLQVDLMDNPESQSVILKDYNLISEGKKK